MEQKLELSLAQGSYQNLNNFVSLIKNQIDKDMDIVIAVDGSKGVGKSTLSMQIAKRYLNLLGKEFDVYKHVAYTFNQIKNAIKEIEENKVLIIDEAVNVMMAEDWSKFESKYLKKVFAKLRVKHELCILCIPDFFWLDKKYRGKMINFWVHVYQRGKGVVFVPIRNPGIEDPWFRDWLIKKLKVKMTDFSSSETFENAISRYPCFLDFVSFPKLEDKYYLPYLERRKEATIEAEDEITTRGKGDIGLVVQAYLLRREGHSLVDIATKLGCSHEMVRVWLKRLQATNPELFPSTDI